MRTRIAMSALIASGMIAGMSQWSGAVERNIDAEPNATTAKRDTPAALDDLAFSPLATLRAGVEGDHAGSQGDGAVAGGGADVILSGIHQVSQYGPVGDIYAYSIGSQTCNIGNVNLQWTNFGTPGLAMNAYRLHEGRLMQIGIGFVKHACCAATFGSCGGLSCNGVGGSQLGVGCLDIYSAGWNAGQSRLGPRTVINPYSGQFNSFDTSTGNSVFKRLQIHADDLNQTTYGDALYFVEGVYVGSDDAAAGNWFNNATYRRVTINSTTFSMAVTADEFPTTPAILAWRHHGNGPNQPDPAVRIQVLDVPGEGRFYVGWKSSDNGDGTWRYEYAVYNLNSHQSAGAFSVNIGEGANISNVGFHAPFYHSGENQDNTPWVHEITSDAITWSTAESHAENPNANAIRWGSMYNFWFDADQPPVTQQAAVDLFIPFDVSGVTFSASGPDAAGVIECPADLNGDEQVNVADLLVLLGEFGACPGGCPADLNGDEVVNVADLLILLGEFGACP